MGILQKARRLAAKLVGAKIREDIFIPDDDEFEDADHKFFRRSQIRGFRSAQRDLPPLRQDEQNRQAFRAYIENAFIRRLARMTAEFIVGAGVSVVSDDKEVQAEIDAWWNDDVNDWETRHFTLAIEFPLYGEIILEKIENLFTGRHRYNWLDPLFVANVLPHAKFPTVPAAITFWDGAHHGGGGRTILARILNGVPEAPILAAAESTITDPKIFYFRTNNLSGSLRGHIAYYPLIEWADVLDNAAFTMGERMVILMTFVWHLQSDTMDEKQKQVWKERLEQANPGSVLLTGKGVDLTAVTPDLKTADFTEGAKFLRSLIAGGAGVPVHFLGDGGDTNLSTAVSMNLPTLRSFLQQQREYVAVLRRLCTANLASVAARGRLTPEQAKDFTIQVDPLNPKDNVTTATALSTLITALSGAKIEGWIADEEARRIIVNVLSGITEIDETITAADIERTNLPPKVTAAMKRVSDFMKADQADAEAIAAQDNGKQEPVVS